MRCDWFLDLDHSELDWASAAIDVALSRAMC